MSIKVALPKYSLLVNRYGLFMLGNPMLQSPVSGQLMIDGIKYDIHLKFRGHHTRGLPRKSYYIRLKQPHRYIGAREFHLNAEYSDPSFIRNKLSLDLFHTFGILSPSSQHVLLYLNDQYQGIYLQLESVDDLFLEKRGHPLGLIYYAINHNANFSLVSPITNNEKKSLSQGYERKLGSYRNNLVLEEFIRKINKTPDDNFQSEIAKYLDTDKYLRWLAVAVCIQNIDGFYHNYALYRNSKTGLFEIMPWDCDATFGRDWNGNIVNCDALPIEGKNYLTKRMLQVPAFRKQYKKLLEELLDTLFTPHYFEPVISSLTESIRPYLLFSSQTEEQQFNKEKEFILTFIRQRSQYIRDHFHTLNE